MTSMTPEEAAQHKAGLQHLTDFLDARAGLRQSAPAPTAEPFAQQTDLVSAMQDPRYKTDADYRRSVAERLAAGRGMRL